MLDLLDNLSSGDRFTILYHSLFSFPLKEAEVKKWQPGRFLKFKFKNLSEVEFKDGFYFLKGKVDQMKLRLKREKYSAKKMRLAREAAKTLEVLPFLKFVGITGSLAMKNAEPDSDIDFLIITQKNTLWTTRVFCFLLLKAKRIPFRRFSGKERKNRLCLNMWFDESNLIWNKRNLFSAHEIAQIIPLLNRDRTYEKFIFENRWIFDFWPNALVLKNFNKGGLVSCCKESLLDKVFYFLVVFLIEPLFYLVQRIYMRRKITKELVLKNRAIFHPVDLDLVVFRKLEKMGVEIL